MKKKNNIKCWVPMIAEYCSYHSNDIQNFGTAPQSLITTYNYLIFCMCRARKIVCT